MFERLLISDPDGTCPKVSASNPRLDRSRRITSGMLREFTKAPVERLNSRT
ncbi:MAG TPA: hypothetical protein VFG14_17940 [Chthoniobacteraceae bacterium]|nr:hypothetical protein [Chthoniobacteraceae bacterium]